MNLFNLCDPLVESEVWFIMRIHMDFFASYSWQDEKNLSLWILMLAVNTVVLKRKSFSIIRFILWSINLFWETSYPSIISCNTLITPQFPLFLSLSLYHVNWKSLWSIKCISYYFKLTKGNPPFPICRESLHDWNQ